MEEMIKIMHIDDELETLQLVRHILGRSKFVVESILNGAEALAKMADDFVPDLVILDLSMPGMDGWEIQQKMQESPRLRDVPIIILSCMKRSGDIAYGLHVARVDDYITKPFSPGELFASIQQALSKHRPAATAAAT